MDNESKNMHIINTRETNYRIKQLTKKDKSIELHNIDCLKGLDNFPDRYFDLIVTSPPYNLGISYNSYNDHIPREKYLEWIKKIALKIKEKMKDNDHFF